METMEQTIKIILGIVFAGWLIWFIARWIVIELHCYRNANAPIETEPVTVALKHPETELAPQGRASSAVHFITFRTDTGKEVRVQMGPRDFYSIPEGSRGTLTWQGERFWKFEPHP